MKSGRMKAKTAETRAISVIGDRESVMGEDSDRILWAGVRGRKGLKRLKAETLKMLKSEKRKLEITEFN